ncbi:hypothetical protein SMRU11_23015 [Sinorhizobium meliloti RU11/001]|nr:hypothetical protein SMRU11_23015 [Sinorhizobium meliloti RU11/001]
MSAPDLFLSSDPEHFRKSRDGVPSGSAYCRSVRSSHCFSEAESGLERDEEKCARFSARIPLLNFLVPITFMF